MSSPDHAGLGRAAGATIGFLLCYAAAEYLRLPRPIVQAAPLGVSIGRFTSGLQMGYYGLLAWGLAGGAAGAVIGARLGARARERGALLATAWVATTLICVTAFFVWNNWP